MNIDLSFFQPTLSKKNGELFILDTTRQKYLVLTPEEWVRQGIISYLSQHGYPTALMQIERAISYPNRLKRPDIIVYTMEGKPFMLIECKAPYITLEETTLSQALAYNSVVNAPYVALTNGQMLYVYETAQKQWLDDLPAYIKQDVR